MCEEILCTFIYFIPPPQQLNGKKSACNTGKEMWVRSLGQEDPLEEGLATFSGIFAWRIPWTEEPGATDHRVAKSWT